MKLTVKKTLPLAGYSNRPGVFYRLWLLAGAALAAICMLVAGQSVLESTWAPVPVARANGGLSGVITHTTVTDFSQSCVVLPGVQASPVFTTVQVISTAGGELHLPPTFVDYFEDGVLDATRWITAAANVGGGEPILNGTPVEANNYVTLNNTAIRSQQVFTPSFGVRFFEGRVRFQDVITAQISTSDVGFGREQRPGFPGVSTTGSRLMIADADQNPFAFYAWGRDGDPATQPLLERDLTPAPDFTTFQTYRVEWDTASDETRFYVNGSEVGTPPITGTTAITTWVWLDSQDAGRPISVDWVRAGQYPTTGGGYRGCVQDAGGVVNWSNFNATANVPANTSLAYRTRTSVDGSVWSAWSTPLTSTLITSPSGRYFQYVAEFSNTTPLRSPELQQVVVNYFGPTVVQVLPNPGNVNPRATQQFTAQALDVNSRPVTGLTYTWQLMAPAAGSLNNTGLFTGTATAAQYTNAISVTTPIIGGTQLVGLATLNILNLPPTANANGPYTVNETAVLTLTGSGSDPNEGAVTYGWDLNNDGVFERPNASITNTWPDNSVITVGFIVTDSVTPNLTTTVTTTVTVNNVAPTISNITNTGPITETSSVTVTVSASDIAGINDPLLYAFDCNNNGVFEIGPQSGSSANCTFGDNGAFTVPISVTDGDGGAATGVTTVTVTNVAPTIASVTNNGPVGEGSPVTVTVSASDVAGANDPLQYAFDCDNNGVYELGPQSGNAGACTFFENGARTVGVRVRDGDGGEATSNTVVTINNVAPSIVALVNTGPITEGLSATITLTATDPAGVNDPLVYAFDCNNDGNYEVGPQPGNSTTCLFGDNGVYTVRARVSDDELASSNDTTEVTVFNSPPVIVAVNVPPVILGNPSNVSVFATDAGGVNDPLQYEFDCNNDGTYEVGPQSSFSTPCPAFPSLGTYTVRVRVTDGDGGVTTATGTANVVDLLKIFLPLVMRGNS